MSSKSYNVSPIITHDCPLHVGIAAPIYLPLLSDYLDNADAIEVEGMGGFSVTYLVRALLSLGVQVRIYTLDPRQTKPLQIEGSQLKVYCGHFRKRGRIKDLIRLERKQHKGFMAVNDPSLIHAHWTYEYAWATVASGNLNLITVRDWSPAILSYHKDLYRFGRLNMPMLGVGTAFDFHAGRVKQAPAWLQVIGLEWLFRLLMEPRRLWRRYVYHNPRFLILFARQLLRIKLGSKT